MIDRRLIFFFDFRRFFVRRPNYSRLLVRVVYHVSFFQYYISFAPFSLELISSLLLLLACVRFLFNNYFREIFGKKNVIGEKNVIGGQIRYVTSSRERNFRAILKRVRAVPAR